MVTRPPLGSSSHVHMGLMWKAHVGVVSFAPGAPYDPIYGPCVENHIGPTMDQTMKYTATWESCKPHLDFLAHGPLINNYFYMGTK